MASLVGEIVCRIGPENTAGSIICNLKNGLVGGVITITLEEGAHTHHQQVQTGLVMEMIRPQSLEYCGLWSVCQRVSRETQ